MKYAQEAFARDLHRGLLRHFSSAIPAAQPSVKGAGANWRCTVELAERACEMCCFDSTFDGSQAEYLSAFSERGQTIVWGRTGSKVDTIEAASAWLKGSSLAELEIKFEFVDDQNRRLSKIMQTAIACSPHIRANTTQEIKRRSCDLCELWFSYRDRSCKLSYYGKNVFADAIFHWDKCELFRLQVGDTAVFTAVLNHWLCEYAMPSHMRATYPWINIGELADYYEAGRPIEGEFLMSWNSIERFYDEKDFPPKEQVLELIAEMRKRGYDRTLRAGQSMYSFVLSRSRRHGLHQHQARLIFSFKENGMEINARFESDTSHSIPQTALLPEVEALLQRLVEVEVD